MTNIPGTQVMDLSHTRSRRMQNAQNVQDTPVLDLTRYHARRYVSGLVLYLTWYFDVNDREQKPCMVILKDNNKGVPFIMPIENAYLYEDPENGHKELLRAAQLCNQALRRRDAMREIYEIADLINGSLLDIVTMPPFPDSERKTVADIIITSGDGRSIHSEVVE